MQVYADLFAIVTLLSGGGLAAYGEPLSHHLSCKVLDKEVNVRLIQINIFRKSEIVQGIELRTYFYNLTLVVSK